MSRTAAVDVGPLEAFEEGRIRLVRVGRNRVGVLRWTNGKIYALRNTCPHQGGPVCEGGVGPMVVAGERGVDVDREHPVVTCAWHHWEFDATTGRAVFDERVRVRTHPVEVRDGRVLVGRAGA
jgi:nitrite reductase/ring-hydroxylating ferredoxin subunit